ncbi:esterase-like activity of phytase family protein [Pelistega ratti]|uniref:esterase-like activity of phytase family protein n=1 Tax=Pelistega ratti TaxID=2652177 RepID=UPI00135798FD|nr:esterase-like activity of phytase family protein [Pelistega ratti]
MKKILFSSIILSTLSFALHTTAKADNTTLIAFAKLDAETYAEGPQSGKATKAANGIAPPFKSQPVQGFSAVLKNKDGTYMAMSDNGFGTQDNSSDFLLRIYHIKPNFKTSQGGTGNVEVLGFISLRDPNKLIPFPIVNQETNDRLLTGADFDIESLQQAEDGSYWIGDEFGPYLLHFSADGILLDAPITLPNPYVKGQELRSPQNQFNKTQKEIIEPLVQRSGGFEGMALSKDKQFLYPILEKPLTNADKKQLIIFQFNIAKKAYTDNYYLFDLDDKATAIGDFQLFDHQSGIIIERDDTENDLTGHKKLILVKLGASGQAVERKELVDLMRIHNPHSLYSPYREGDIGTGKDFAFPFITIEDIVIESPDTLTIFNDNNFPGSSGRNAKLADDNEIIQIKLDQPLF